MIFLTLFLPGRCAKTLRHRAKTQAIENDPLFEARAHPTDVLISEARGQIRPGHPATYFRPHETIQPHHIIARSDPSASRSLETSESADLLRRDELDNEDLALFRILSVFPPSVGASSAAEIAIAFWPESDLFCSCRFGSVIVDGTVESDHRLHCQAPFHRAGVVNLSISKNRVDFQGSFPFRFEEGFTFWLFHIILPLILLVAVAIWVGLRFRPFGGRRGKKQGWLLFLRGKFRRNRRILQSRRQTGAFI
jgi:hypothetical protein